MVQWFVQPVDDIAGRSSSWQVKKGGNKTPTTDHRKKSAALKEARRRAKKGDKIAVCGRDGKIQRWIG